MSTVCTQCGFQNPPGMRFCGNCGTRLTGEISQPQHINQDSQAPGQSAPNADPEILGVMTGFDLLDRFRKAGLEASGQRRSVTVLFVDLSDYTRLSEELPDEELYELVQKFIRLLVSDVFKYEGMVDKLTGDGLMALFGAPIAHENNAERAIRAAMEMVSDVARLSQEIDLHGHSLSVHVGLNSGSVIVGGLGGDGLMNYTAIGDSVNLARRLEESAVSGTILVSESVYAQTNRIFNFERLPPIKLKNVTKEVSAFQVLSLKNTPGPVRGIEGLRAPMIGREFEYNQVMRMVDNLLENRKGGLILLVGEGGMGKSRLTREVMSALDPDRLIVLEGQSLTYRKSIPYWIFQDLIRNSMGVPSHAAAAAVHKKLIETACSVFGDQARDKIPFFEHLFSFPNSDRAAAEKIQYLEPSQLRQQVFMAVRDWLFAMVHDRPLLCVMEDLHWADETSLELLRFLIGSVRNSPVIFYAITRPFEGGTFQAIHERAQQILGDQYQYLRLQPLPPDQSAQLLQALLSIGDLPDSLYQQIIERSAGLPFYLEEIIRMLIERKVIIREKDEWRFSPQIGHDEIGVPDTLQGLILARFDRLSLSQRRLLQTASVAGYQFSSFLLGQVLAIQHEELSPPEILEALSQLVEKEFLISQERGEAENANITDDISYQFKHVLLSDAVYSTLLQRDRRELHTRVGEAIEKVYAGQLTEYTEVLAGHFLRSPYLDRALHYLLLSGQKAARGYANDQALSLFRQAAELLPGVDHSPEQALRVHCGLGDALITAGDYSEARKHYIEAIETLGVSGRTGALSVIPNLTNRLHLEKSETLCLLSQLQRKVSKSLENQGEYDKALIYLQAAQAILVSDSPAYQLEKAYCLNDAGWIFFRRGSLDQAESMLMEGLEIAEKAGQIDVTASILNRLAGIYFQRDLVEKASGFLQRSLRLREEIGDIVAVARTYNNLGLINWKQGFLQKALEEFNRSYRLQSNLGDIEGQIVLQTNMGLIEMDCGNLDEAQVHFLSALETARQIGHQFHVSITQMHLALLSVFAENWQAVLDYSLASLAGFQDLGVEENLVDLNVSLGWAYLGLGDKERGGETQQYLISKLREGTVSTSGPSEGFGRAYRVLARFAEYQGDRPGAVDALQRSIEIFRQVGNPLELSRSQVDLGQMLANDGQTDRAKVLFGEAREVFLQMGANLELSRLAQIEANISK